MAKCLSRSEQSNCRPVRRASGFLLVLGLHLQMERLYPQSAAEDALPRDPSAAKCAFSSKVCGHPICQSIDSPPSEVIVKGYYQQETSVLWAVRPRERNSQGLATGSLICRYYRTVHQRDDSRHVCLQQVPNQRVYSPHSPQRRPECLGRYSPARGRNPLTQQSVILTRFITGNNSLPLCGNRSHTWFRGNRVRRDGPLISRNCVLRTRMQARPVRAQRLHCGSRPSPAMCQWQKASAERFY